ncbi:MAG: ABC transporter C-terminal domain-containing protein [Candidatus Eremiobacteraeota bacterium]|nr:ABC transporter C-terminal domain-containing protein [Candidatus Eremiobacteraeota bacterium]
MWLREGVATVIDGGYDRFEEAQRPDAPRSEAARTPEREPKRDAAPTIAVVQRDERSQRGREARELAAAEREVARLDAACARLQSEFADPAIYDDRTRVAALERELGDARAEMEAAFERWEALASQGARTRETA